VSPDVQPPRKVSQARATTRLRATDKPRQPQPTTGKGEVRSETVPGSVAKRVQPAKDESAKAGDALHVDGRELYLIFEDSGRVHVQIRDSDGNVLRTIPPSRALSVVPGDRQD
jgi:hypothetical protein